jgi:hypothetical protein
MLKVIFACVHNAGRPQMAAAFFNQLPDSVKAEAISVGTRPGERDHPEVLFVVKEVGIDLTHAKPQKLTDDLAKMLTSSSQWGVATNAPTFRVYAGMIDRFPTRRGSPSRRSGRYVTKSNAMCRSLSSTKT